MKHNCLLLAALLGLFLGPPAKAQESDWDAQIRKRVAAHQLREALQIVEDRLAEAPQDLEAAGWRARLLAWTGRWQEAESEYRHLLALVPRDVDALVGLASLLTWKQQYAESLSPLENAAQIDPNRSDIYLAKGQALRGLGRTEQARVAFKQALVFEPSNADARAGLPVRGVEVTYHQHWFWYQNARVLELTPGIVFYFPRGWTWSLHGTAARSHLSGLGAEWQPSGSTRLDFPLYRSLSGNTLFGVGTEDFAMVDQIGRFLARAFGGGLKYSLNWRQELTNYVFKQYRSQGQTQTSFGFSYAIHS